MKRNMIQALHDGCPAWSKDPDAQQSVLSKYKKYGDQVNIWITNDFTINSRRKYVNLMNFIYSQYTPEEAEWYGYNLYEATKKIAEIREIEAERKIVPLKHQLRANLIAEFKAMGLDQIERVVARSEKGQIVTAQDG